MSYFDPSFYLRFLDVDLRGQATSIDVVQNVIRNIQEQTKTKNW